MSIYNALHRFLEGDLIWQMPTLLAGLIAILLAMISRKLWKQILVFVVMFLTLAIVFHMLLDAPIHAFQTWWTKPLGPSMILK